MTTHLYRHFGNDGALLYVGVSLSTVQRLAQHKDASHWFADIKQVTIENFENRKDALDAERKAIANENPLHNLRRPSPAESEKQTPAIEAKRALLRRVVQFEPLYTMDNAASALSVTRATLKKLMDGNELGYVTISDRRYVTGWQLISYLETLDSGAVR